MRNWEDKLEWSQRSSLVFQTAKRILHILKQLSIVCLDFCFTIFDRVLKDNTASKQLDEEKPWVLQTTLLCQCCHFLPLGLTLANCRASMIAPVCLTDSHKVQISSSCHIQGAGRMDTGQRLSFMSNGYFIGKQLIWRGFSNTEGLG